MKSFATAIGCALVAAASSNASAQALKFPPWLSVSGFGTAGLVGTNTDLGQYVNDLRQETGASKSVDSTVDSKLGLQATATLDPMFSATLQMLSLRDPEGSWTPRTEWAYAKSRFESGLSLRVGRMGAPFFMVSDFRDVGYANTWVRPPVDVYGQVPFDTFDGADALYEGRLLGSTFNAQLYAGRSKPSFPGGPVLDARGMVGINASADLGPVTLRVGHMETHITLAGSSGFDSLVAALDGASQMPGLGSLAGLATQLAADDKHASFSGVGAAVDLDRFFASAEYTRRRTDSYLASTTGWYATAGYRLGNWTPNLTLSRRRQDSPTTTNAIPPVPALAPLAAGIDGLLASIGQKTVELGVRWDLHANMALKAQFDHIKVDAGGPGAFVNTQPGFGSAPIDVYSLSLDFVF